MFYKMINKKRDEWYNSSTCTVKALIEYIIQRDIMRDAQIEAIKTYLFLKIPCENKPLHTLFANGTFNSINLDDTELTTTAKDYLKNHPSALALFEYASLTDDNGTELSPKVMRAIKDNPQSIDYESVFKKAFYDISYTDYLFSLPMGAGKTYLMAAFIYIDLYFAQNEPDNKAFAHNFIIFAPSGLKTSVIPSLRTIQDFNPDWIIPEPAASDLKRKLIFEVLDQNRTANRSNRTKNPNVQKIAIHQPLEDLFGLVAVTNAEKVILDRIKEDHGQFSFFEESTDDKDKQANELRNLIGKLPQLSVFIDEVHHAATDDKKLRAVVSKWMQNHTLNGVIGFSGTPYLQKAEKIQADDTLSISSIEISNIVYYYPLINGIGNFLKKPSVFISNSKSRFEIVEAGIREFLNRYKDTVYFDGTCAKLGIYCGGSIEILEEQIYPLAEKIATEYGLNPREAVLKFHGGNAKYSMPVDSELQFASLDKPLSKVRIVLLVQIGKEGWDCHSLTGVVLSQEGDCPTNMVLQTSCRCLRQVKRYEHETALIYLNEKNAETLNLQLQRQHHISIKEFEHGSSGLLTTIKRYDRTSYLQLPKMDFYQLKISYNTIIIDENKDTENNIANSYSSATISVITKEAELAKDLHIVAGGIHTEFIEKGTMITDFKTWLYTIAKQSFGFIKMVMLNEQKNRLKTVFDAITYSKDGLTYFSSKYHIDVINANIRKAFYEKRTFDTLEELIPEKATLLKVDNFKTEVQATDSDSKAYFPDANTSERIVLADEGKLGMDEKTKQAIKVLEDLGKKDVADALRVPTISHPMKDNSFHYLPYKTDSNFEQTFLTEVLNLALVTQKGLEVYYNGDRALTEFQIKCYKKNKTAWKYIGMYTPDFLILQRKDKAIHRAIIVETKGKIYATDPTFADKRSFMETAFTAKNNEQFGYKRFDYLYLEDSLTDNERISATALAIEKFFEGEC